MHSRHNYRCYNTKLKVNSYVYHKKRYSKRLKVYSEKGYGNNNILHPAKIYRIDDRTNRGLNPLFHMVSLINGESFTADASFFIPISKKKAEQLSVINSL